MGELQALLIDGVHVSLDHIDQQHLILTGEIHAVDAAHGAGADDSYFHDFLLP